MPMHPYVVNKLIFGVQQNNMDIFMLLSHTFYFETKCYPSTSER